ncbi:unnamed protein product [Lactuca virosa]|uniref:RAB6-interacting golgin n=1 Tax=Lactuca virosa TaxID=75947 RepID=A0AAU9NRN9_9ASTR|nr:unnamed protein product [Lactuca virosa]
MSSPFTESIPMDQDSESSVVEEVVMPTEGAQYSRSSVFDLEQSSAEKDLIIGKQDIRISELEKENLIKDSKISELQGNLGGLTALFFNLKLRLFQKFGDEFHPLSAEGEKINASSSGPANPTPQSSSERVARPAPDANLDTFL